ncbi:class A beta-lactamase [Microbacterium sp. 3J1]|uniref:class A beta-lactamase n=1 Tax=Microbacterium sp. 3J1 TaxID=861269 RepID=UPI00159EC9F4|nr:class A beta-lactamase [Microbacterium sp. 3J1]
MKRISELEKSSEVTIGVVAGDGTRARIEHRADELFPMCSLFKTLLVAELLERHSYDSAFWSKTITFTPDDIVVNSLITAADPDGQMTIDELADAALRYSDNTAGNLLLREVGGPSGLTSTLRRVGAQWTRLDRWEPELNEATADDPRDTSTPREIHRLFSDALIGSRLDQLGRARLMSWMLQNQTTSTRIGAALPEGAELADKTGAGGYGVVNDAGVVFLENRAVSLAILTRTSDSSAVGNNDVVRDTARIVLDDLL